MPLEPVRSELHITLIRVGRREGGEQGGGGSCPVKLRWISLFSILNMLAGTHSSAFFVAHFAIESPSFQQLKYMYRGIKLHVVEG